MLFIISTSKESLNTEENFFWSKEYFQKIKNFIPDSVTEVINITSAIAYFVKSNQKDKNAIQLKVKSSQLTKDYLKVKCVSEVPLSYTSYQIKYALKKYFKVKSILDLPFCSVVDDAKFFEIIENYKLYALIEDLEKTNKWDAIYQKFLEFNPIEKSKIWNNAELISKFSFAAAKLAECTENLKRKFPDKNHKEKFIAEKRKLRKLTIKLRNRCIELEPENASFYSNIAYSFYQSVTELNTPGGRRDGNVFTESLEAIKYLDKSLELEGSRVTDYYRKGFILTEFLANNLLFKNDDENNRVKKIEEARKYILSGIESFEQAVYAFENLIDNEFDIKKYRKYYIKSLYHLAQNYLQLSKADFNILNLLYNQSPVNKNKEAVEQKISLLEKAEYFIDKCIEQDYNRNKTEIFLIDKVAVNNFMPGVYKAYIKALINLFTFINADKNKHSDTAKDYFQKALEISFPKEIENQNKIFVLEKIALQNIIENKYDAALNLLEPLYKSKKLLPAYAAYTLAIIYLLKNLQEKAEELIEKYIKLGDKNFKNKFMKLKEYCTNKITKPTVTSVSNA